MPSATSTLSDSSMLQHDCGSEGLSESVGGPFAAVAAAPAFSEARVSSSGSGGRIVSSSALPHGIAMAWAATSPADKERFICIYPAYLNNKKTIAEGRRIPMDKAIENPTSTEIQDVCAAIGLNVLVEKNKLYPREWNRDMQYRGRVRVQLKQEDGNPCLPQFPTRKSVMLYAAETIPKLKTRTQKMGGSDQNLQPGEGGKKGKGKKKK